MPNVALVTGAHGFIGRHVARALAAQGWRVTGLGHERWTDAEARAWGLDAWHEASIGADALDGLAAEPQLIFHAAGTSTVGASFADPQAEFERTVQSTSALLEAMRLRWPQALLVYPSSAAVYGQVSAMPIAIGTPTAPVSPYGTFKEQAEQLCRTYHERFGVRSVILRIFSVYGTGLRKQLLWDACSRFAAGDAGAVGAANAVRFAGTGDEIRDWIHIDDLVRLAMLVATQPPQAGISCFNAGTGVGTDVRTVLEAIAKNFHAGSPRFSGQTRPGDPRAYVADISQTRALGWEPTVAVADGIAQYVEWFRSDRRRQSGPT